MSDPVKNIGAPYTVIIVAGDMSAHSPNNYDQEVGFKEDIRYMDKSVPPNATKLYLLEKDVLGVANGMGKSLDRDTFFSSIKNVLHKHGKGGMVLFAQVGHGGKGPSLILPSGEKVTAEELADLFQNNINQRDKPYTAIILGGCFTGGFPKAWINTDHPFNFIYTDSAPYSWAWGGGDWKDLFDKQSDLNHDGITTLSEAFRHTMQTSHYDSQAITILTDKSPDIDIRGNIAPTPYFKKHIEQALSHQALIDDMNKIPFGEQVVVLIKGNEPESDSLDAWFTNETTTGSGLYRFITIADNAESRAYFHTNGQSAIFALGPNLPRKGIRLSLTEPIGKQIPKAVVNADPFQVATEWTDRYHDLDTVNGLFDNPNYQPTITPAQRLASMLNSGDVDQITTALSIFQKIMVLANDKDDPFDPSPYKEVILDFERHLATATADFYYADREGIFNTICDINEKFFNTVTIYTEVAVPFSQLIFDEKADPKTRWNQLIVATYFTNYSYTNRRWDHVWEDVSKKIYDQRIYTTLLHKLKTISYNDATPMAVYFEEPDATSIDAFVNLIMTIPPGQVVDRTAKSRQHFGLAIRETTEVGIIQQAFSDWYTYGFLNYHFETLAKNADIALQRAIAFNVAHIAPDSSTFDLGSIINIYHTLQDPVAKEYLLYSISHSPISLLDKLGQSTPEQRQLFVDILTFYRNLPEEKGHKKWAYLMQGNELDKATALIMAAYFPLRSEEREYLVAHLKTSPKINRNILLTLVERSTGQELHPYLDFFTSLIDNRRSKNAKLADIALNKIIRFLAENGSNNTLQDDISTLLFEPFPTGINTDVYYSYFDSLDDLKSLAAKAENEKDVITFDGSVGAGFGITMAHDTTDVGALAMFRGDLTHPMVFDRHGRNSYGLGFNTQATLYSNITRSGDISFLPSAGLSINWIQYSNIFPEKTPRSAPKDEKYRHILDVSQKLSIDLNFAAKLGLDGGATYGGQLDAHYVPSTLPFSLSASLYFFPQTQEFIPTIGTSYVF